MVDHDCCLYFFDHLSKRRADWILPKGNLSSQFPFLIITKSPKTYRYMRTLLVSLNAAIKVLREIVEDGLHEARIRFFCTYSLFLDYQFYKVVSLSRNINAKKMLMFLYIYSTSYKKL